MESMMKRIIFLLLLITVSLNAQSNLLKFEESETQPFVMNVTTASVTISMKGTGLIRVVWGDNSFTDYTLTSTAQNVAHTYSGSATYKIAIYNPQKVTYWSCSDNAGYAFNWSETRKMRMTSFYCYGSNTLSGTLSLPSVMTSFVCAGSNTLSGTLSLPSVMTSFGCAGSNTLSGTLSLPSVMTSFGCAGSNTLSGTLSLPSVMTSFNCYGSNTLSGTLSLPSVMTSFYCYGSNTLSGTLSLPSVMTSFGCAGSNTLSGYSTQSFSNNINYFYLVTSFGTGFSAAEVDQLCIDLDGSTWAGSGKTLRLTGSKIAAPTATSAAARTSLGNKGITIITN
jgi:hypothetical protein